MLYKNMNDSISMSISSSDRFVDSMIQQNHYLGCGELGCPESLMIQPGCFDWSGFGVATFACIIAIVTCIFTILMYKKVKQQLKVANDQLVTNYNQVQTQMKRNAEDEKNREKVMTDTKKYVGQINLQIINNSLIDLVEKRQRIIQDYDYLHNYLSKNSYLLEDGPVLLKDKTLRPIIDNIVVNLHLIRDILNLFTFDNKSFISIYDTIINSFEELKSKEKIATNMDNVDKWLDDFKSQEIDFTKEVNNSIEQIKNDIKTK